MFRRKLILALAVATVAAGVPACSSSGSSSSAQNAADTSTPVAVKLAVSNITNQSYIPLLLAQQLGFFKKQGLNVSIANVNSGSQTFTMLAAKQVQGVVGFMDHDIDLTAKGSPTESVVQLLQAPGMVEMVRTDEADTITTPAGLAGKNVGVTGIGGSTEFLADYLAAHNGGGTIHAVGVTSGAPLLASMTNKQIDAAVTTEPSITSLLSKKLAKIIVDMRSVTGTQAALGGPYPGTALSVQNAWAKANPTTVQKLVNALVEALHWIQQHSAAQIVDQLPATYYAGPGKAAYTQALANEIGMYSPTGLMPTDGPQSIYRVLSLFDPAVKGHTVDLSQVYTETFVQNAPAS